MMTSISAVSEQAIEYAKASLIDGRRLSQASMPSLVGMTAVAVVPEGSSAQRALDFKRGGLGRCDFAEVASLLARAYPAASLVVELPLWRPDDPGISESGPRILVCGDDVYGMCNLADSRGSIEKTLRLADPSFMYNAAIVDHEGEMSADACPAELIDSGAARVRAVLVGAYDGEGFVFANDLSSL